MKKIGLLLLPALLITTACKTTSTSVTSSGGDVSSTSDSSSVEPIRFATPQEALRFLREESYTFNIKSDYYGDDTEGKESNRLRLRREGLIFEGSELVEGDEGTHFEPVCYLDSTNEDAEQSYYLENGFWLREDGVSKQVEQFLSPLTATENMLGDIVEPKLVEWSYDEEKGIYHGDTTTPDTHAEFFIQMSPVFFDEIKIFSTSVAGSFHADVTITVKDAGSTIVELPETPISDIFVSMGNIANAMRHLNSFTIECVQGETSYVGKVQVFRDARYMLLEWTYDGSTMLFKDEWDEHGVDSYYIYNSGGDQWQTTTKEVFENISSLIFVSDELDAYGDQDELAQDVAEVVECTAGRFSLSLESAIILDVHFDADTYVLSEMNVNGNNPTTYSYSNIDSTEIIF